MAPDSSAVPVEGFRCGRTVGKGRVRQLEPLSTVAGRFLPGDDGAGRPAAGEQDRVAVRSPFTNQGVCASRSRRFRASTRRDAAPGTPTAADPCGESNGHNYGAAPKVCRHRCTERTLTLRSLAIAELTSP
ncbi:hypothetical protein GCM10017667_42210 [Streptomyces filamentosus]|uniref:Uncharacterized protein n=1 Tax=Streptomyces filamentosus TaxID=67294 RepID=A0A919BRF3_STRFL|nr:hypothetical protein GCM10017667_42210 [Streptomyces filamentosus]